MTYNVISANIDEQLVRQGGMQTLQSCSALPTCLFQQMLALAVLHGAVVEV